MSAVRQSGDFGKLIHIKIVVDAAQAGVAGRGASKAMAKDGHASKVDHAAVGTAKGRLRVGACSRGCIVVDGLGFGSA